jgi:WD40 repeat protein
VRGGKVSDKAMKDGGKKSTASSTSKMAVNKQARAVVASLKHQHVVVCNNLGKVSIRVWDDFDKKVASLKGAAQWCEVARYSPCENYLAIGSHDNHVYIYSINEQHEYLLLAKDERNHAWINGIDWTQDSKFLRTSSGDYEVLYWNVAENRGDDHGSETVGTK